MIKVSKPIIYSTAEANTGKKWIDGKPIYRYMIIGNTGADGKEVALPFQYSEIISMHGIFIQDGLYSMPLPIYYNGENYIYCNIYGGKLVLNAYGAYKNQPFKMVVEYTS